MPYHHPRLRLIFATYAANAALFYDLSMWTKNLVETLRGYTIRDNGMLWEIHDPTNGEPSERVRLVEHTGRGMLWETTDEQRIDEDDLDDDDTGDDWKQ